MDTFWTLFGQLTSENRRTFAPDFETNDLMTGVGLIGTAAAWLNLNKAKAEYEALVERREGLLSAVATYMSSRLNEYYKREAESLPDNSVDYMDGVEMTTILRVGNLVGKLFRVQTSVVLTNLSEKTYYIKDVEAECILYDAVPVWVFDLNFTQTWNQKGGKDDIPQKVVVDKFLKPGETIEIKLPHGKSALPDEYKERLVSDICNACNRKLITSCWKVSLEDIETADILITWANEDKKDNFKSLRTGMKGILRYCMEAFYPSN